MTRLINVFFSLAGVLVIALGTNGCSGNTVDNHQGEQLMPAKTIEAVLQEHTEELMAIPGVVGTAQGLCDDKPCLRVYVTKKTPELEQKLPDTIEGFVVDLVETGEIRALPKSPE